MRPRLFSACSKDTGHEVKLSNDASTYTVTVLTPSDGKLESLQLNKACLEHMIRLGESEAERSAADANARLEQMTRLRDSEAASKSEAAPESSACLLM